MTLAPTREQIMALAELPDEGPVVMLNLLKYAERGKGEAADAGMSGEQSYAKYGEEMRARLESMGARLIWRGRVDTVVIGEDADAWDEVLLVEYPSRKAFLEMVANQDYQKTSRHRENALVDSRLIATTEKFRLAP